MQVTCLTALVFVAALFAVVAGSQSILDADDDYDNRRNTNNRNDNRRNSGSRSNILNAGGDYQDRHRSLSGNRDREWGNDRNRNRGGSSILDGDDDYNRRRGGTGSWGGGGTSGSGSRSGGGSSGTGSGSWGRGGGSSGTGSGSWGRGGGSSGTGSFNNRGSTGGSGSRWDDDRFGTGQRWDRDYDQNRHRYRGYCAGITGRVECPRDSEKARMVKVQLMTSDHDFESRDEEMMDEAFTSHEGHFAVEGCAKHSRRQQNELHLHIFHKCGEEEPQKLKIMIPKRNAWRQLSTINLERPDRTVEKLRFLGRESDLRPTICTA